MPRARRSARRRSRTARCAPGRRAAALQWSGMAPAPCIAPKAEPAVAPLQSVSQPPCTASPIVRVKSPSPHSSAAATTVALLMLWTGLSAPWRSSSTSRAASQPSPAACSSATPRSASAEPRGGRHLAQCGRERRAHVRGGEARRRSARPPTSRRRRRSRRGRATRRRARGRRRRPDRPGTRSRRRPRGSSRRSTRGTG